MMRLIERSNMWRKLLSKKEEHAKTQNAKDTLTVREQNGTQRAPFSKRDTKVYRTP